MYIQITTRCNMTCEHCGMDCGVEGDDMEVKTFKNAVDHDECATIGGGEPTIHPKFWEFIGLALGRAEYVWLATNGKETDTALALAGLAKRGVIGCGVGIGISTDIKINGVLTDGQHDFISAIANTSARLKAIAVCMDIGSGDWHV